MRGCQRRRNFAKFSEIMKHRLTFLLTLAFVSAANALELHPLVTNHGVLQQELSVPICGSADPDAEVTVSFAGQEHTTKADEEGIWILTLDPLTASAEGRTLTVSSGDTTVEVIDLLVGEVWVASGQSNMAWTVERSFSYEETVAAADEGRFENVRLFKVPVDGADEPRSHVDAAWAIPSALSVKTFSAVGFFFGAELSRDRSVPVGIIQSANGGTNAFSWINSDTFASDPAAGPARGYWATTLKNHPKAMERYTEALKTWREKASEAKAAGSKMAERAPREPLGPDHVKRPSGHYNAMIAPIQPYAIRGAIWYQGEANSREPFYANYRDLMFALVEDWRADWAHASMGKIERRDFPFYLVQLPNFAGGDAKGWPMIREQMLRFWEEGTNTGMVVAIDKGEADDIHPGDKEPIGQRLARFARADTYGENIAFSGPIYEGLQIEGDKAIVTFKHAGEGLASLNGEPLRYFEVADAEGNFESAEATIEGTTLVVTSDKITEPRAVRYAWMNNPEGANLGNKDGLPASPFRTDSWDD